MPAVPTPRISLHQALRKSDDFSATGTVSFPFCLTSGGSPQALILAGMVCILIGLIGFVKWVRTV